MPERSRLCRTCLPRGADVFRNGRVVISNEFIRPEGCSNAHLSPPWHAHVDAGITVPVAILDDVPEPNLHDRPICYAVMSSHGFTATSLLGSAVNASSSFNLSHTVRELMRLGAGIRPSLTSVSNSDGEMPT